MGKYQDYYDTRSLADLRKRQRINAAQTVQAYRLAQGWDGCERGHRALIRLQRNARLLQAAVMKRC